MQKRYILFPLLLLLTFSCSKFSANDPDPISVSGVVTNSSDEPVEEATVTILSPSPEETTVTDSEGSYNFSRFIEESVTYNIEVTKDGYQNSTRQFTVDPSNSINFPDFKLALPGEDNSDDGDDNNDDNGNNTGSQGSAFITLDNITNQTIQVKETGGVETTQFNFVITDSAGTPVDNQNAVYVHFDIAEGPNGGESIYPDSVLTNNGEAIASLTSGTAAGVVQVRASFTRDEEVHVSKPVSVTISGGLPDTNHFEVKSDRKNQVADGTSQDNTITVLLGDKYGNTVREGTAVYFTTNKGTIDGDRTTDQNGTVSADLRSVNAAPGTATVTVKTIDENSTTIEKGVEIVFSGSPLLSVESGSIDVENFTREDFSYTLQDNNGNPMAEGTNVNVSFNNENLELTGDIDFTLGDYSESGDGKTDFGFQVTKLDDVEISGNLSLTILAEGPNGSTRKTLTFGGDDLEPAEPGSIYLSSSSANSIGVKGTSQREDATFTFIVQDKNGNPVGRENPAEVTFNFGNQPNGGESLSPTTATTNNNGEVSTTLTSGTIAGTVQVIAEVKSDNGDEILSKPVAIVIHSGLPDQDHLTFRSERNNIPYQEVGTKVTVTLLAGDRYGNNAQAGTMVYFTTDGGFIEGSAAINEQGEATTQLTIANPFPPNGIATLTATTADDQQNEISETHQVVFSDSPQINIESGSIDPENFTSENFTYSLKDSYGNPLSEGTTISVEIDNQDIELSGDIDVALADYSQGGNGKTEFGFRASNPSGEEIFGNLTLTISTEGPNGSERETVTFEGSEPEPEEPGSIYLESVSTNTIGVKGTMQREDAQLTFIVQDKNGNPVGDENAADVEFSFGSHPNGGEELFPATATTNSQGEVTTTLTSGTAAGTVQVIAEVITSNGDVILSKPVAVVIEAGLPDEDHFTLVNLNSEQRNVAFEIGTKVEYRAYVGDRHGNNAQSGTMIYFTTDGGYIEGSSPINDQGEATVTLTVADPYPPNGIATITASTGDDLQNTITSDTETMFSRDPIITIDPETFALGNGEDQTFNYTVMDSNGNPMVAGTSITVTVEGEDIEVIGDVDITVNAPNSDFSNLDQLTNYTFNFRDSDRDKDENTPVYITIEVEGENGTARKVITGTKSKVAP